MIRLNKKNKSGATTSTSNSVSSGGSANIGASSTSTTSNVDAYLWGNHFTGSNSISGDMSVLGNVTLRAIEDDEDSGIVTAPKGSIDVLESSQISNTGKLSTENLEASTGAVNALQSHSIETSELTSTEATIHNLKVTGVAQFTELEIDKIKSVGGAMILSPANGFDIVEIEEDDNLFRLFFPIEQDNLFEVGDLVISYEWSSGNTTYYWTEVIGLGANDNYNYIEISKSGDGLVEPKVGQTVVHLGNKSDASRQNAIIMSSHNLPIESLSGPFYCQYTGIASVGDLQAHRSSYFSPEGNCITGDFKVSTGQSIEDYISAYANNSGNTYNILDGTNQGTSGWSYWSDNYDSNFVISSDLNNYLCVNGNIQEYITLYYEIKDLNAFADKEVYTLSFKTDGLTIDNTDIYISIKDKNGSNVLAPEVKAEYVNGTWVAQVTMDIQDVGVGILPMSNEYALRSAQHIYIYIPKPTMSFKLYDLMMSLGEISSPRWFISRNDFLDSSALDGIEDTISELCVQQDSITASVNQTSLAITNGQITLNGNTSIHGNLVLDSHFDEDTQSEVDDTGFTLRDSYTNEGICRIAPMSIGSYETFNKTSNVTLDKVVSNDVAITLVNNTTAQKTFSFTNTISLGTVTSGETIVIKNSQLSTISDISSLYSIFSAPKAIQVKYELLDEYGNIVATSAYVSENDTSTLISYESKGLEYNLRVTVSGIVEAFINNDVSFTGTLNTIVSVQLKFKYILPTTSNLLIGYDGISINFGDTNHVYIGKDKCVFKYGNYGFELSNKGLTIND
jgi:hypothetical protein